MAYSSLYLLIFSFLGSYCIFFVPPLQVRCDGARRNREGAGGGRSDFKGKLVPLRECFHASLVTRPLQLPFVLRAIKSVPLDDPEVCCRNGHTHAS